MLKLLLKIIWLTYLVSHSKVYSSRYLFPPFLAKCLWLMLLTQGMVESLDLNVLCRTHLSDLYFVSLFFWVIKDIRFFFFFQGKNYHQILIVLKCDLQNQNTLAMYSYLITYYVPRTLLNILCSLSHLSSKRIPSDK